MEDRQRNHEETDTEDQKNLNLECLSHLSAPNECENSTEAEDIRGNVAASNDLPAQQLQSQRSLASLPHSAEK